MTNININDPETDTILEKYLPEYENNKSLLIRDCIKHYDNYRQQQKKRLDLFLFFQFLIFLILGAGLLSFAIGSYIFIAFIVAPILFVISGVMLVLFAFMLMINKKKMVGDTV